MSTLRDYLAANPFTAVAGDTDPTLDPGVPADLLRGIAQLIAAGHPGASYADASGTLPASGSQPVEALPADPDRRYLIVHNPGSNPMSVRVGATDAGALTLPAGGNWEPLVAPTGAVYLSGTEGDPFTLYAA